MDLHPEAALDRLRAGSLRQDERVRLIEHCKTCAACALELRLATGVDAEPGLADIALGDAVIEHMLASRARPPSAPRARSSRAAALIAAGVVLGCSMTAAALVTDVPASVVRIVAIWTRSVEALSGPRAPRHARGERTRVAPAARPATPVVPGLAAPRPVTEPAGAAAIRGTSDDAIEGARSASRRVSDRARAPAQRSSGAAPRLALDRAQALLAAASRARVEHRDVEAVNLYRLLQRDYAGSENEITARVSLGRLLCLRLGQERPALALFSAYLSARPSGALAQEALEGRASCLDRFGHAQAARSAWQELLDAHPGSVYAAEARKRLAAP